VGLLYGAAIGSIKELYSGSVLFLEGTLSAMLLYLIYIFTRIERPITVLEAFLIVVLTWLISPFIAAVPFAVISGLPFLDAMFEAVSGLTGTGLTVMSHVIELQPVSIKLLRGFLQWYGEMGIAVAAIAIFSRPGTVTAPLYLAEGRGGRIEVTVKGTARTILRIYLVYTLLCTLALLLTGMTPLDAFVHSMTAVATGGFSNWHDSLKHYADLLGPRFLPMEVAVVLFMILGAISFIDHAKLFRGDVRGFFSIETNTLLILLALSSLSTVVTYMLVDGVSTPKAIELGIFHAVSALTTTGFQIEDLCKVSDATKVILAFSMIIGGCTCSTVGGIKVYRLIVLLKYLQWLLKSTLYPSHILIKRIVGGRTLTDDVVARVTSFTSLYLFTLLISSSILTALGYRFVDSFFEVASAMGCVGLSVGITSPQLHPLGKVILMVDMLLGKLEFYPFLVATYAMIGKLKTRIS